MDGPILLTGATGFIGRHAYDALVARGHRVRCASRDPERARARLPGREWVRLDVGDPSSLRAALEGARGALFLVHAMAEGHGYAERERKAALAFRDAASAAGLQRVVYLGGVAPHGAPSDHLASRLETGRLLRQGEVSTVELRAGMVLGAGSESWKICRDLAARLPFMILPRWLQSRSQPIAVEDVVFALAHALELSPHLCGLYDLPGPEVLTAEQILFRIARLRGTNPRALNVPVLTPKLSSYWLRFVSGADYAIARELVEGLEHDLVATEPSFWSLVPDHDLVPFDVAARRALAEEAPGSRRTRALEAVASRLSRPATD